MPTKMRPRSIDAQVPIRIELDPVMTATGRIVPKIPSSNFLQSEAVGGIPTGSQNSETYREADTTDTDTISRNEEPKGTFEMREQLYSFILQLQIFSRHHLLDFDVASHQIHMYEQQIACMEPDPLELRRLFLEHLRTGSNGVWEHEDAVPDLDLSQEQVEAELTQLLEEIPALYFTGYGYYQEEEDSNHEDIGADMLLPTWSELAERVRNIAVDNDENDHQVPETPIPSQDTPHQSFPTYHRDMRELSGRGQPFPQARKLEQDVNGFAVLRTQEQIREHNRSVLHRLAVRDRDYLDFLRQNCERSGPRW